MLRLSTHGATKAAKSIAFHMFPNFTNGACGMGCCSCGLRFIFPGSPGLAGTITIEFSKREFVKKLAKEIHQNLDIEVHGIDGHVFSYQSCTTVALTFRASDLSSLTEVSNRLPTSTSAGDKATQANTSPQRQAGTSKPPIQARNSSRRAPYTTTRHPSKMAGYLSPSSTSDVTNVDPSTTSQPGPSSSLHRAHISAPPMRPLANPSEPSIHAMHRYNGGPSTFHAPPPIPADWPTPPMAPATGTSISRGPDAHQNLDKLREARAEMARQISAYQNHVAEMQNAGAELAVLREAVARLEGEKGAVLVQLLEERVALQGARAETEAVRAALRTVREEAIAGERERGELRGRIGELEGELEQAKGLRATVRALEDEKAAAVQELRDSQSELQTAQADAGAFLAVVETLRASIASREKDIGCLRGRVTELEDERTKASTLREELNALRESAAAADKEIATLRDEVASLQGIESEAKSLREALKKSEDATAAAQSEVDGIQVRLDKLRDADLAVRLELKSVKKAKASVEQEMFILKDQLAELGRKDVETDALRGQLEKAQADRADIEQRKIEVEQTLRKHASKYDEAEVELAALRDVVSGLVQKIEHDIPAELRQRVAPLEEEVETLRSKGVEDGKQVEKLRARTGELLKQVAALQANEATLTMRIAELSVERASLMAQNAELYEQAVSGHLAKAPS